MATRAELRAARDAAKAQYDTSLAALDAAVTACDAATAAVWSLVPNAKKNDMLNAQEDLRSKKSEAESAGRYYMDSVIALSMAALKG